MDDFIIEKKNIYSDMTNNYNSLIENIKNLDEKKLNEKIIFQIKNIMGSITRLNDDIIDLNNNIIYDHFDSNEKLKNKIEEQENINKIINDLMPLYILKSLELKNT